MAQTFQISTSTVGGKSSSPWVYFLDWILSLILALAFVFFFSRLIGFIVSFILKLFLWKRSKVRITIEALRISPLGGRIFAKNLVIVTQDYTISVLALNFSWRYWIFRIIRISDFYYQARNDVNPGLSREENEKLPNRFVLYLEGLEVFMHNRTFAYDNIEQMLSQKKQDPAEETTFSMTGDGSSQSKALPYLLRLLPIKIRIKKGTFILGNSTTPTIFVASYKSAYGIIDLHQSPCPLDYFRHVYNFSLDQFQLSMKPNISYDDSKHGQPATALNHKSSTVHLNRQRQYNFWHKFHQASKKIVNLLRPKKHQSQLNLDEATKQWRGLRRYVDTDPRSPNNVHLNTEEEYAKYSLILDSALTRFIYYFDSLGNYPQKEDPSIFVQPEYGLNIELEVATIHYGPWADKQRVPIQQMFFPPLSRDSEPTRPARPGNKRQYEGFKIEMSVKDELIFRVPVREPSKDKDIIRSLAQNDRDVLPGAKISRSFGWVELKVAAKSSISSYTSFTSSKEKGWANKLSLYLLQPELRTSVNHDILFIADTHILECDIGFPLKWNAPCMWKFVNHSTNGRLFLLREHIFLFLDLFADFASGMPPAYENLRPFEYIFDWNIDNYKWYLNVNDSNIIDNPLDFDSNKYISFEGERLETHILIPLNGNLTRSSTISFQIYTPALRAMLSTPPWHTIDAFSETQEIGRTKDFSVGGSYTFFSIIDHSTTNQIVIRIVGDYVTLRFYGYLVRYLFIARENYFGDNVKFKTFEEYANNSESPTTQTPFDSSSTLKVSTTDDEKEVRKFVKIENDLDVEFVFLVRHGLLVLPYHLYTTSSHIAFSFDSFDIDLRFTNYYMDIQADFSPARGVFVSEQEESTLMFDIPAYTEKYFNNGPELLIDGLNVHAHRMFGIPPDQITYYCKWDFAAGSIEIDSEARFITGLGTSIKSFIFTFKDLENILVPNLPIVHDAANFSFRCPSFAIKLRPAQQRDTCSMIVIDLGSMMLCLNDLPNERYNTRITVSLPEIFVSILGEPGPEGVRKTLGHVGTSLTFSNYIIKANSEEIRHLQRLHIKKNDGPFHRCAFIMPAADRDFSYKSALGSLETHLTLPEASIPLNRDTVDEYDYLFESSSSSSVSSRSSKSTFSFDETSASSEYPFDYDEAEFCPEFEKLPGTKYACAVLQLGEIQAFFSPRSIAEFSKLSANLKDLRVERLLDEIEFEMVGNIRKLILSLSEDVSFRLVTPEVNIKFGDIDTYDPRSVFDLPLDIPLVSISLQEPSLARSKAQRYYADCEALPLESSTLAGHIKEIYVSISDPSQFKPAVSVSIKDIELWQDSDEERNEVSSVTIGDIDLALEELQVNFLQLYITGLKAAMSPILKEHKRLVNVEARAEAEVVHQLSLASDHHRIDYDSAVLTKPAHVLRSVHDHVRTYDSWKIIIRLRHVLENAPAEWKQALNENLRAIEFNTPDSAYEEVLEIFSRWRSWEADTGNGFLFKKVFDREIQPATASKSGYKFEIHTFNLTLTGLGDAPNRINLESPTISIHKMNGSNDINSTDTNGGSIILVLCHVNRYLSFISPLTIDLIKLFDKKHSQEQCGTKEKQSEDSERLTSSTPKSGILACIKISSYDQTVKLLNTSLNLSGTGAAHSVHFFTMKDTTELIFSSQLEAVAINAFAANESLFRLSTESTRFLVASNGHLIEGPKVVEIGSEVLSVQAIEQNSKICHTLETMVKGDIEYLKGLKEHSLTESTATKQAVETSQSKPHLNVSCQLRIANLYTHVNILDPLTFVSSSRDIKLAFGLWGTSIFVDYCLGNTELSLLIAERTLCTIENSDLRLKLMVKSQQALLCDIDLNWGFTKVNFPQVNLAMLEIETNLPQLQARVNALRPISMNMSEKTREPTKGKATPKRTIAFTSRIANDYLSLSVGFDTSKVTLELEGVESSASSIQINHNENKPNDYILTPIHGDLSIPSTRISLVDRQIPVSLSTVVDFNIVIKISNDSSATSQALQVESQYFRIVMSPPVVYRALNIGNKLTRSLSRFTNSLRKSELLTMFQRQELKQVRDESENLKMNTDGLFSRFASIHVLSYNWCLGWIFPKQYKDYPGVIMGAERFFAVTEKEIGKFTLIDAYLSVANGFTSSDFFSNLSERMSLNRAFLPNIQLCYFVDEPADGTKNLRIKMTGDELDICFLSNSVLLIERFLQSATEVRMFLEKMRNGYIPHAKSSTEEKLKTDEHRPFEPWFNSVEFLSYFAGSNMVLWSNDQLTMSDAPALSLHSPAVKFITKYNHYRTGPKRHVIKSEMLGSASDNTVYASCVPVMAEFVNGFKHMMRPKDRDEQVHEPSKDRRKLLISGSKTNMAEMLRNFDVHIGIRLEKQRLSLSCEPTAKVEAVVGIDGICIQINTVQGEFASINMALRLDPLYASLQHIYSREISASLNISKVVLMSSVEMSETSSVISSCSISDVIGAVDAKQFLDVDLFKDIWLPKSLYADGDKQADTAENTHPKNISSSFKEVSTAYAIPWIFTLVVSNTRLRMDVGQALGNFDLKLNTFWLVSKKSTDWTQNLKLGTDLILLTSEGRLGGVLQINDAYLHTAIRWKYGQEVLDIPLILVSGGINLFQMKASFDYHVFAIIDMRGSSVDIYNQKNEHTTSKDHLFVTTNIESAALYITSLAASNVIDISNAVSRVIQENRRSYSETLRDSSTEHNATKSSGITNAASRVMLETVKKLEFRIEVLFGKLLIYVYPSSLEDSRVLVVKVDQSRAHFQQTEITAGVSNQLDINFSGINVSLSVAPTIKPELVVNGTVSEFVDLAQKAKGGNIFVFPSLRICMRTYQKYESFEIEYLFQSAFGGTVEVKWNLGSVNFIREMYAIHKRAFLTRIEYRKEGDAPRLPMSPASPMSQNPPTSPLSDKKDIEQDIKDTLAKVTEESSYRYTPLAPPIIEAPKLKELGNATPPLEWFGLHRNRFPDATHQLAIVNLQKFIHQIEAQYSKILGKA